MHFHMRAVAIFGKGSKQITNLIVAAQFSRREWLIAVSASKSIRAILK